MGMLDRFRKSNPMPADAPPPNSGSLANRATQIYRNNPKVVGGLALLASALVLNRMKRPPA